jgi:hypothetical protein
MRAAALILFVLIGLACQHPQAPCSAVDVCASRAATYPCRATRAFEEDGCPTEGPTADGQPARRVATVGSFSGSTGTAYRVECLDGRTRYCSCKMVDGQPTWECFNAM